MTEAEVHILQQKCRALITLCNEISTRTPREFSAPYKIADKGERSAEAANYSSVCKDFILTWRKTLLDNSLAETDFFVLPSIGSYSNLECAEQLLTHLLTLETAAQLATLSELLQGLEWVNVKLGAREEQWLFVQSLYARIKVAQPKLDMLHGWPEDETMTLDLPGIYVSRNNCEPLELLLLASSCRAK